MLLMILYETRGVGNEGCRLETKFLQEQSEVMSKHYV